MQSYPYVAVVIPLILATVHHAGASEAYRHLEPLDVPGLTRMTIAEDIAFSGSHCNSTSHSNAPMVTVGGQQFVAFYDFEKLVRVASRNIDTTEWTVHKTAFELARPDGHFAISLGASPDGFLHMMWSNHHTPMNYAVSVNPHDASAWRKTDMIPGQDGTAEYPQFITDAKQSVLLCLYNRQMPKKNGKGYGSKHNVINRYDPQSTSWSRVGRFPFSEWCTSTAHIGPAGTIKFAAEMGRGSGNIFLAESTDLGQTWRRRHVHTLPKAATEQGFGMLNQPGMAYDREGNFFMALLRYDETQKRVPQVYLLRQDGDSWHEHRITESTTQSGMSYVGRRRTAASHTRSWLVVDDADRAIVLFNDRVERGNVLSVAISDPKNYDTWTFRTIDDRRLYGANPQFDITMWMQHRRLSMLLIPCGRDGAGERPPGPQDVMVVDWPFGSPEPAVGK